MHLRTILVFAVVLVVVGLILGQPQKEEDGDVESAHIAGPGGLEGWTLNEPISNHGSSQDSRPFILVIARHGKALRRIPGEPFLWQWIFWDNGRQIAYETGSLHFNLQCNLFDLATGRKLDAIDCFHGVPDNAPAWAETLESRAH